MGQGHDIDPSTADTMVSETPSPAAAAPTTGPPRPGSDDPLIGTQLHHFEVGELIGRGGMGAVYRARDLSLDRPVALKVIAGELAQHPLVRERFVREARAQARLNHHAVVPIYYIGQQQELYFFAMELVEGAALDERLERDEPLDSQEAIDLLEQVASALRLAQQRGIVHRDIKPSNLLVDSEGRVKVADFGLAKTVGQADDATLTQKGEVLGTPLYMSPEQGQGETTDHRADIYSLGATFYHLCTGRPPFTADTAMGVVIQHCTKPLPPVRQLRPDVSPALAAVLERMLAKKPSQRYADYDALLADLEAARPQPSTTAGFWVRAMAQLVDFVLFSIAAAVLGGPLATAAFVAYVVVGWWRRGQTLGKWVFRIKVRARGDRGRPSLGQALLRFVALYWFVIAWLLFSGITHLIVGQGKAFRGTVSWQELQPYFPLMATAALLVLATLGHVMWIMLRRGFHDRLARTEVVYRLEPSATHRRSPSGVRRSATASRPAVSKPASRP